MAPLPSSIPLLLRAAFKRGGPLPAGGTELVRTGYRIERIDRQQLGRYNRALGFAEGALPVTYLYLLVQRAHLASMLGPGAPFRIAGMIHVANELAELQPVDADAPLELDTVVTLAPPQPNGAVHVLLSTTGRQDGRAVFTCSSDYLAVRGGRGAGKSPSASPALPELGRWTLSRAAGRAYAGVSGDWNPIHLWPWTARLMGMRAPIIHGMHTLGKACALLEMQGERHVGAISARFKAPIALPGEAILTGDLAAQAYAVLSGGREAVTGEFAWSAAASDQHVA
jgi:hypothetical protein